MKPSSRRILAAALTAMATALLAATAAWGVGGLSPHAGPTGCFSVTRFQEVCKKGRMLSGAEGIVVSPDGRSVYVVGYRSEGFTVYGRNPASGTLTQPAGRRGCFSEERGTGCTYARALDEPQDLAVSPDGSTVYVVGVDSDSIAIFDRNPRTGAMRQKAGAGGCISASGSGGACQTDPLVQEPSAIAVSPDGKSVYTGNSGSETMSVFDRDPATGALIDKPGAAGCFAAARTGIAAACQYAPLASEQFKLVISPDGRNVYVSETRPSVVDPAHLAAGLLLSFDRDKATGTLTLRPGAAGCIATRATEDGCRVYKAVTVPLGLAVSRDGRSVYVTSESAVSIFSRDADTGSLSPKRGKAGCISSRALGSKRFGCRRGRGLANATGVAVSSDGKNVYVASVGERRLSRPSVNSAALTILDRDPTTGALRQKPGPAGCISADPTARHCRHFAALSRAASVAVSADGRNVYVAGSTPGSVSSFDRSIRQSRVTADIR